MVDGGGVVAVAEHPGGERVFPPTPVALPPSTLPYPPPPRT